MAAPGGLADARAWLAEADRLHAARQFAEAAAHYREALARDATLFDAWYGLGFAEGSMGEHGHAVIALRGRSPSRPRSRAFASIWVNRCSRLAGCRRRSGNMSRRRRGR